VNCWVAPFASAAVAGATVTVVRAGVTVRAVEPVTPASVAVTVAGPTATAVARPAAFTVRTALFELVHVAIVVTFAVDPSE